MSEPVPQCCQDHDPQPGSHPCWIAREIARQGALLESIVVTMRLQADPQYRAALAEAESESWDGPGVSAEDMIAAANTRLAPVVHWLTRNVATACGTGGTGQAALVNAGLNSTIRDMVTCPACKDTTAWRTT